MASRLRRVFLSSGTLAPRRSCTPRSCWRDGSARNFLRGSPSADGRPTRDPVATLEGGSVRAWGGAKGSGLAIVVQLLGAMCASPPMPRDMHDFGCVVMSPGLLMPVEAFKTSVKDYAEAVRLTRPVEGGSPVRMPFDRSAAERRRRIAADIIEVPDAIRAVETDLRRLKIVEPCGALG